MNPCSKDYIGDIKFTDTGFSYTMALISGKHKMAILYCLMKFEPIRFNEMKRFLENITDKTLSSNLKELESDNLIIRKEYPQIPPKVEYSLSEKGKTLMEVLDSYAYGAKKIKGHSKKITSTIENSKVLVISYSDYIIVCTGGLPVKKIF